MLLTACYVVAAAILGNITLVRLASRGPASRSRPGITELAIGLFLAVLTAFWCSIPVWAIIYIPLHLLVGWSLDLTGRLELFAGIAIIIFFIALPYTLRRV